MSDRAGLHIANGIALLGLLIAAALLEIYDKENSWLWFGSFLWIVFGFWGRASENRYRSSTGKIEEDQETAITNEIEDMS